ncbi:MAG: GNAT family N-acetyltransferase [Caldicoprobacterales bacterium]|nr:GNAT family N-acetyltransferase [Clostridiales bacterium]
MHEEMRLAKRDEYQELEAFLERAFGHSRGFYARNFPNRRAKAKNWSLIIRKQSGIIGNVTTYPLDIKIGPSVVTVGGIGSVGVDPGSRGQGYMGRLMERSIEIMAEKQIPLSVLWGDRQRYNHLGYETCGHKYRLEFTRRSLERAGIRPMEVEEADKQDPALAEKLKKLHETLDYRVMRGSIELLLARPQVRVFTGGESYLISINETRGDLIIQEIVSPEGKEAELILGAMEWTNGQKASLEMEAVASPAHARLAAASSSWTIGPQGMFRIINWPKLCEALSPYFAQKAKDLPPFEIAIGCTWKENRQMATLVWDGSKFLTVPGRETEKYIELEGPVLAATLFGGPCAYNNSLGLFEKLLPVPIHIPNIDHI